MSNIIEFLRGTKKNKDEYNSEVNAKIILREIKNIMADIACADMWFEFEEDSDLLESCIYYKESLEARYRYLLKKAKFNNIVIAKKS